MRTSGVMAAAAAANTTRGCRVQRTAELMRNIDEVRRRAGVYGGNAIGD
jgi:hypothetical protein